MDLIELDDVLVSPELNRVVWRVVDQVVGHPLANASNLEGRAVRPGQPGEVVDVVVLGDVIAGGERLAVSAAQPDAALTEKDSA
jgi:hypothetical protein